MWNGHSQRHKKMTAVHACHYDNELYLSAPNIVLPARQYSNMDIVDRIKSNFSGSDLEWRKIERRLSYIFSLFGSEYRYLEDESPRGVADYAADTVTACLQEQNVAAGEIDAVLYGGICREYFEPATAIQVAALAGIERPAAAIDISAACAGVLSAITVFAALASTDRRIRNGVVMAAEGTGRSNDQIGNICYNIQRASDLVGRAAGLTLGNASGALLLSKTQPRSGGRILASLTENYPEHHKLSTAHINGTFECDSFGLFREWRLFPPHIKRLADSLGWGVDDIAAFCVHQPSERLVEKIAAEFKIAERRVPRLHAKYGNTVTLAPVMALDKLVKEQRLNAGDKIILSAAGSGIALTSVAIQWC